MFVSKTFAGHATVFESRFMKLLELDYFIGHLDVKNLGLFSLRLNFSEIAFVITCEVFSMQAATQ